MFPNFDYGDLDENNSDSRNGLLLHDIEEISNALYVDIKTQKNLSISSCSTNLGMKSHLGFTNSKSKAKSKLGFDRHYSIWDWRRPLKALSHIMHRKFACYFFCHVHCVENLGLDFNGSTMNVYWKRKDSVLRTRPCRVLNGVVDFEETLMTKCIVYGSRNGTKSFMKYDPKHFLIFVGVVGNEGVNVGKHWVDLTRLLPLTMEELEKDKCSGKWSTSFMLEGKAKGATLHVSFGFLVTKDSLVELGGNFKLPPILNLERSGFNRTRLVPECVLNKGNTSLRRIGSVPITRTNDCSNSYQSLDVNDFSNSIDELYGKLEESKSDQSADIDLICEQLESLKLTPNSLDEDLGGVEHDNNEFTVIDKGVESESTSEVIDAEETKSWEKEISDLLANELLIDKHSIIDFEELAEIEPSLDTISDEFKASCINKEGLLEIQEIQKLVKRKGKGNMVKQLSLDDVSKAVVDDFCNLWEESSTPSTPSSNSNLESPRERLLRQFEEDMMTSENFFIKVDLPDEEPEPKPKPEPFIITEASRSKIKAESLERVETQSLMERWGLSEEAFMNSPYYGEGGFGSPVFVPSEVEEAFGLPPLGEGLDSLLVLKNGGLLRSMSPLLFRNAKNCGSLIMQASRLVVLPGKLGYDIMGVLQGMASVGSERLCKKLRCLLPLDEVSGNIIQQLAWEASDEAEADSRLASTDHESDITIGIEGFSTVSDILTEYITTRNLSILALDNMEHLTLEGLKVQSNMSNENAPSVIKVTSVNYDQSSDINGLLDHSISLDEWLRLDSEMFTDENDIKEQTLNILRAHNSKNIAGEEFTRNKSRKYGFLGDNLMLGLMIQLRDPIRNYEPVSTPMLGLIQMERVSCSSDSENDDQQMGPTFIMKEIHVAGLNLECDNAESWASKRLQESGSRWLLASGLTHKPDSHFPKSGSLVRLSNQLLRKRGTKNLLWSISRPVQGLHSRNPDIIFQ